MAKQIYTGNVRSAPLWAGDFGGREHILPVPAKLDPTQFQDGAGIQVVASGAAAQGATSIPVNALALATLASTVVIAQGNVLIPNGTVLDFGGAKFARLTADALNGATALTVSALVTALAGGETADYQKFGTEEVPSGTPVGRTYAQRDAGGLFLPADPANHDEIYLTCFEVRDARFNNDIELYRPGGLVKENYLPNYATVLAPGGTASTLLTKLRTIYRCIKGVD